MRATAQDPDTAELVGIDSRAVYARATAIAVAIAAIAGVFLAIRSTLLPRTPGPTELIFAFEAVVIGGLGSSLWGTLAGRDRARRRADDRRARSTPSTRCSPATSCSCVVLASPRGGLLTLRGAHRAAERRRERRRAAAPRADVRGPRWTPAVGRLHDRLRRARRRAGASSRSCSSANAVQEMTTLLHPRADGGDVERARRATAAWSRSASRPTSASARTPRSGSPTTASTRTSRWCSPRCSAAPSRSRCRSSCCASAARSSRSGRGSSPRRSAIYVSFDSSLGAGTGTSLIQLERLRPGPARALHLLARRSA